MVKGISRRVIVVKAPVHGIFEQAIFFVGDGPFSGTEVDAENILREACAVADDYVRTHCNPGRRLFPKPFLIAAISSAITLLIASAIYFFVL